MPRYPLLPNCIFRETFDSLSSVAQNKGIVTGTPSINGSLVFTNSASQKITYKKGGLLNNATKAVIEVDFTTTSDVSSDQTIFSESDGGANHPYWMRISSGNCILYLTTGAIYGLFAVSPNTRYVVRYSYDGTQGTPNNRLLCFVNGSSQALTYSGTIPAVMANLGYDTTIGGTQAGNTNLINFKYNGVAIYKNVISSLEEALDAYQQDTITEIDASKALVHLPLRSWYYKENGTQLLTNGDFEGAAGPPPAGWGVLRGTNTREAGTRTGGSGSYVGQVAYDGVNANGQLNQNILTIGKRYKVTGWYRASDTGVVVSITEGTGVGFSGAGTVAWSSVNFEMVAAGTYLTLYVSSLSAGKWAQFDDISVQLMEARTDNIGSLGGSLLVGDGSTVATIPTQLSPQGITVNGSQYLKKLSAEVTTPTAAFSVGMLMKTNDQTDYQTLMWKWNISNGFALALSGAASNGKVVFYIASGAVTANTKINDGTWHSVVAAYDGASIFIYVDGRYDGGGGLANNLAGNTSDLLIGFGPGSFTGLRGSIKNPFYYNSFTLTPTQIKAWHNKMMKTLNV